MDLDRNTTGLLGEGKSKSWTHRAQYHPQPGKIRPETLRIALNQSLFGPYLGLSGVP